MHHVSDIQETCDNGKLVLHHIILTLFGNFSLQISVFLSFANIVNVSDLLSECNGNGLSNLA